MAFKPDISVVIKSGKPRKGNKHQGKSNCAICNLSFDSQCDYRKHYKNIHMVNCQKTVSARQLYKKRSKKVLKTITCEQCNEVLKGNIEIRKHLKLHRKEVGSCEYVCSMCGQKCQGKWKLQEHMYKFHGHIDQDLHHCGECKLIFQSKIKFEKHLECCKSSNFECRNCLHKFSNYLDFKRHQDSRTCASFICNLCGFKTKEKCYLRTHLLKKHNHVEDGTFYCDICKKTFTLKKCFEDHMECHRNSGFKCNHCPQTFEDYHKLRSHQNTHRRHCCPECSLVFTASHQLRVSNKRDNKYYWRLGGDKWKMIFWSRLPF